jgi:uncharacterized protein
MDPRDAYRALRERVDAFETAAFERGADLQCRAGCEACCHVELEVSPLEASFVVARLRELDTDALDALAQRLDAPDDDRCVMLDDDGRCRVYEARPLVCRSQGLALAYPPGFLPLEAVFARLGGADDDDEPEGAASEGGGAGDGSSDENEKHLTWCPLNFTERPPSLPDVLDAGRLDEALALLNRAFVGAGDPLERVALRDLVSDARDRTLR